MTNAELIEKLKQFPPNAEVYYNHGGVPECEIEGLPVYELYTLDVPEYFEKLRSCRSALPCINSVKENVIILSLY